MTFPPEVQMLIDQMRKRFPELRNLPDEKIADVLRKFTQDMSKSQKNIAQVKNLPAVKLMMRGHEFMQLGKWKDAEEYLLLAAEAAEKENQPTVQCEAYRLLGHLCNHRGDYDQAMILFQKILPLANWIGDKTWLYEIYLDIGENYRNQGKYSHAIEYFKKSLLSEDQRQISSGFASLGMVYTEQGDLQNAIDVLKKGIEIDISRGDDINRAGKLGSLGLIYQELGKLELAMEMHLKSLELSLQSPEGIDNVANQYSNLGNVHYRLGDYEAAIRMHEKALEIDEKMGNAHGAAQTYGYIALVYSKINDIGRALSYFKRSINILESIGDQHNVARQYFHLGDLHANCGNVNEARENYEKAKALYQSVGAFKYAQLSDDKIRML